MPIRRVRSVTTGLAGGPYLSTHYFTHVESTSVDDTVDAVHAFWIALRTEIGLPATIAISGEVPIIDEVTGDIVEQLVGTGQQTTGAGASSPEWSAKNGVLNLRTGSYVSGRPVNGRLFIPGVSSSSGEQTPSGGYRVALESAGNGLVAATTSIGPWVVWSRANGSAPAVTGTSASRQWGVLRSRRT